MLTLRSPQHNKEGDLWVIVDSIVYDLSKFGNLHPGGLGVLLDAEVGEWQRLITLHYHQASHGAHNPFQPDWTPQLCSTACTARRSFRDRSISACGSGPSTARSRESGPTFLDSCRGWGYRGFLARTEPDILSRSHMPNPLG